MMLEVPDYPHAILGVGFVKLLRGEFPDCTEMTPAARAIAVWLYEHTMTDEERGEVDEAFPELLGPLDCE
jgi:hypothetical protein